MGMGTLWVGVWVGATVPTGLPMLISSQAVDEKDFSLGNGEAEEVDGNLVGKGVKD